MYAVTLLSTVLLEFWDCVDYNQFNQGRNLLAFFWG